MFGRRQLFKHKHLPGGASGGAYVSPYLLEILSTRSGAPAWVSATGTLTANTGQVVSCSRASAGYCLGGDGLLHLLGSNTVRVEPTGLLVEGASTNVLAGSTTPGNLTYWTWQAGNNGTYAMNVTGPDGVANSAATVTSPTGGAGCRMYQSVGYGVQTQSIYVTRGTARYIHFYPAAAVEAWWDWDVLDWTNKSGTTAATVFRGDFFKTIDGNDWYRISITINNGAAAFSDFSPHNTVANLEFGAGDGTTMICWMPQIEPLPFPTSPIPTTSAAASRAGDNLTVANPLSLGPYRVGWTLTPLTGTWANFAFGPILCTTPTSGAQNWIRTYADSIGRYGIEPWDNAGAQAGWTTPYPPGESFAEHSFNVYTPNDGTTITMLVDGVPVTAAPYLSTRILAGMAGPITIGYDAFANHVTAMHLTNILVNDS